MAAARRFFAIHELLTSAELARLYTDALINSSCIIPAVRDRLGISKSPAYKFINHLDEFGLVEELDQFDVVEETELYDGLMTGGGSQIMDHILRSVAP